MIGQQKVLSKLNSLIDNHNLSHTILFEGPWGCGKHTLSKEIATKLNLDYYDITSTISLELLTQIVLTPLPALYFIDGNEITIKQQNAVLKFLEEPNVNFYIVVACESTSTLLPTVVNRCQKFTFEGYSNEELKQFLTDSDNAEQILAYATTPGWVIEFNNHPIQDVVALCEKIFLKIDIANFSNILTIPDKIALTKEEIEKGEKIPFQIFTLILLKTALKLYKNSSIIYNRYELTQEFCNDCTISNINKRQLLESYLIKLKLTVGGK